MSLWSNGAITHATLLEMLQLGEILPHIDVEEEIEAVEAEKLVNMDIGLAGSQPVEQDEPAAEQTAEESEMRQELTRRLRAQADAASEDND